MTYPNPRVLIILLCSGCNLSKMKRATPISMIFTYLTMWSVIARGNVVKTNFIITLKELP